MYVVVVYVHVHVMNVVVTELCIYIVLWLFQWGCLVFAVYAYFYSDSDSMTSSFYYFK